MQEKYEKILKKDFEYAKHITKKHWNIIESKVKNPQSYQCITDIQQRKDDVLFSHIMYINFLNQSIKCFLIVLNKKEEYVFMCKSASGNNFIVDNTILNNDNTISFTSKITNSEDYILIGKG